MISSRLLHPSRRGVLAGLGAFALARPAFAATPAVVATTGMIGDAAARILGAPVRTLMGPGLDPHGYRQTRSDIAALVGADLVLWHGLYLEAQMEEFLLDLGTRKPVVAVAEAVPKDRLRASVQYPDRFDPHVWFDPSLWTFAVAEVLRALVALRPEMAEAMAAREAAYQAEIAALDGYAREVLATVPPEARLLVTAHDAFSYFARAYGWDVEGIQGISTQSEAGLARVAEVVDLLVARKVGAVFVESSVSDRTIRALAEGAAAKGHDVRIGGELFSDAMGPEGTYEGTYPGMFDHNVTLIARALGGQAPETGFAGRLTA
jgi:manganese/zinc/iron transport system substrate-binding protein